MAANADVFGTGYLMTTVTPGPDGTVTWSRVPGVNNDSHFPALPAGLAERVRAMRPTPVRFVLPSTMSSITSAWTLTGRTPFASAVRADPASPIMHACFRTLAIGIAELHDVLATVDLDNGQTPPPGLQRLNEWVQGAPASRAGAPYRVQLRSALGTQRWNALCDAISALMPTDTSATLTHGWFSIGNVVVSTPTQPGSQDYPTEVLTGTDLGYARPEFDLGFMIGDLREYGYWAQKAGEPSTAYLHLENILTALYSAPLDDQLLAAATAARVTLHSRDFASYVGWYDDLDAYPELISELIDQI